MDTIQAARELGKAIQLDERYVKMMLAQQKSDEDQGLQKMIADFTEIRTKLNTQIGQKEKDGALISALDGEMKSLYQQIFENENMTAYNEARNEMQEMLSFVNQIINGSAQGQDPGSIEYQASCGGDCGGCSGCS